MSSDEREWVFVPADKIVSFAAGLDPRTVTVSGSTGCGASLVTDVVGEDVFAGRMPTKQDTDVLMVMWQLLNSEGQHMLETLGLADSYHRVASLGVGESLVRVRHRERS